MGAARMPAALSWLRVTHFRRHTEKEMYEVSIFIMNSAERREARYQRRKAARAARRAELAKEHGTFEAVFSFERLYDAYRGSIKGVG